MIGVILEQLDADALIELFSLLFGCGIEVARDGFDIAILIDGAFAVYENSPALKRVLNRFFSAAALTSVPTEQSTQ